MTDETKGQETFPEFSEEDGQKKESNGHVDVKRVEMTLTDTEQQAEERPTTAISEGAKVLPLGKEETRSKAKHVVFEGPSTLRNSKGMGDVLLNKSKSPHAIIESLRNNKLVDKHLYRDNPIDSANFRILPVDWLGLPLCASTLPDFISTTKLHYRRPASAVVPQQQHRSLPVLKTADDLSIPGQSFHDQFLDVDWVQTDLFPPKIFGGYSKKDGQMTEVLPHPKSSIWNIPESMAERIKKKDPMEYLNLLDPRNIIPTERAIYQWILQDKGEVGLEVTVGESIKSSGFSQNRIPHVPVREDRDFHSVYKKSFCLRPKKNDIEGLLSIEHRDLEYPGYGGSTTMRDLPSSFERFGPNVLKTKPDFAKNNLRRIKSARPIF